VRILSTFGFVGYITGFILYAITQISCMVIQVQSVDF
jgi:hypothetical protein